MKDRIIKDSLFRYSKGDTVPISSLKFHLDAAKTIDDGIDLPKFRHNNRVYTILAAEFHPMGYNWHLRVIDKHGHVILIALDGLYVSYNGSELEDVDHVVTYTPEAFWTRFHGEVQEHAPAYLEYKDNVYRMPSFARIYGHDGVLVSLVDRTGASYLVQVSEEYNGAFQVEDKKWSIVNGRTLETVGVSDR